MKIRLNLETCKLLISSALIILLFLTISHAQQKPSLKIMISGKVLKIIPLQEMKNKLEVQTISFFDPYYSKEKNFKAFKLKDFLNLAYGNSWKNDKYTDLSFLAYDGYDAVSTTSKLEEDGGYLVFEDIDFPDWEPIGERKSYPGPLFLVWIKKDQTAESGYPWPWQLVSANLIKFADQFPAVVPSGADKNSSAYRGFLIFKTRCIKCHSINRQGGSIGPDLNAPMSIVEYRSINIIKEFIKNPLKYRYSQMPDNPDLTENDLDDLIDYFIYKSKYKN